MITLCPLDCIDWDLGFHSSIIRPLSHLCFSLLSASCQLLAVRVLHPATRCDHHNGIPMPFEVSCSRASNGTAREKEGDAVWVAQQEKNCISAMLLDPVTISLANQSYCPALRNHHCDTAEQHLQPVQHGCVPSKSWPNPGQTQSFSFRVVVMSLRTCLIFLALYYQGSCKRLMKHLSFLLRHN